MRTLKLAFIEEKLRKRVMNPKNLIVPVERGRDFDSRLEVVNSFRSLALGTMYEAKKAVRLTELQLLTFIREKTNRTRCDFFSGVWLIVPTEQPSEVD